MVTAVSLELSDSPLGTDVNEGLARVEQSLQDVARTEDALLTDASRHLINAGGKRFRATLVLLAAQFGDPHDPRVVPGAVAIELTHLATLYHDDVMDEAAIRRGHESANSRWSNTVAILTGDFLFARASQILAGLGPEAIRIQAETFVRLVTGQVAETVGPAPGQDPLEHYLGVVTNKTGSLIATSGRFGAMLSGAPDEVTAQDRARVRGAGHRLPAVRRHHRRGQRLRAAGQGARHRPARGSTDPAHAARAALRRPVGRPARTSCCARASSPIRGCTPRRWRCCGPTPRWRAARADLRRWADMARRDILALPDVPGAGRLRGALRLRGGAHRLTRPGARPRFSLSGTR